MRSKRGGSDRRWAAIASIVSSILTVIVAGVAPAAESGEVIEFAGACGGSAGIPIDDERFAISDDGSSDIVAYRYDTPQKPLSTQNLDHYLGIPRARGTKSADISGAARIGRRSFWIGSHGRDEFGLLRFRHQRFFQMEVLAGEDSLTLRERGNPYRPLLDKMILVPDLYRLGMGPVVGARIKRNKALAPDRGGFAIQGLAQTKDALGVWVGLGSPMYQGKAVLVPIENPIAVIETEVDPVFGEPVLLDLGGLTIRDLAYSVIRDVYVVLAGPQRGEGLQRIFQWTGDPKSKPVDTGITLPADFRAEAIILSEAGDRAFVTSDDGDHEIPVEQRAECQNWKKAPPYTCRCDFLIGRDKRRFRGIHVALPELAAPAPPPAPEG